MTYGLGWRRWPIDGTDPMYPAILSVLGTVCVALAGMAVPAIRRVVRPVTGVAPTGRAAAGLATWAVVLLSVMYAFAIALPGFYGMELEQLVLAVPDIAGLTYLAIGLAGVLLVLRVAVTTRRLHRSRRVGDPRDTPDEND